MGSSLMRGEQGVDRLGIRGGFADGARLLEGGQALLEKRKVWRAYWLFKGKRFFLIKKLRFSNHKRGGRFLEKGWGI